VLRIKFSAGRQFCASKSPTSYSRKTLWAIIKKTNMNRTFLIFIGVALTSCSIPEAKKNQVIVVGGKNHDETHIIDLGFLGEVDRSFNEKLEGKWVKQTNLRDTLYFGFAKDLLTALQKFCFHLQTKGKLKFLFLRLHLQTLTMYYVHSILQIIPDKSLQNLKH
jgi:hypothetical protein